MDSLNTDSIFAAVTRYCRYQERCHQEARNKLYELGCNRTEVENYIVKLIEAGILNEERFARLYAGGKFRMKQWGREKIKFELKQRKISDYCIRKGLSEINEEDYAITLSRLTNKKITQLKSIKNQLVVRQKLYNYLVQKGYERDMAKDSIEVCLKK